jgi:hypothetical protein
VTARSRHHRPEVVFVGGGNDDLFYQANRHALFTLDDQVAELTIASIHEAACAFTIYSL